MTIQKLIHRLKHLYIITQEDRLTANLYWDKVVNPFNRLNRVGVS